jgi:hypothetical protein
VFEVLEHEIINYPEDSGEEVDDTHEAKLICVAHSELHKVVAQPRLMPYKDMIGWALENIDVQTRSITNHQKVFVGSFRPKHIQVMYKLCLEPKYTYNIAFLLEFEQQECIQYDKSYPDIIKSWWGHPEKFKADAHGVYATSSLDTHMIYVAVILCRLFRKKSPTHFPVEWVSTMHEVVKGYTFNWAKILSDNLAEEITEYKLAKSKGQPAPFYMSTYIMDVICFITPFPLMNWSWTPTSAKPIHFYHSKLWEDKAKDLFYEIYHNVVVPVHIALYGCPPPLISYRIMGNLGKLADWFIEENFSYIKVFGCSVPPHALPIFLPDRLVCREVAYQTVIGSINKELKAAPKKVWPTFPLQVGMFSLLDFSHSKVEVAALDDVKLVDIEFKRHDPHKIVENHMAQYNLKKCVHENSPRDEMFRGVRSYEEVLIGFQTLSPDQQTNFLSFQRHRQNSLPKILQGESIVAPPTQEYVPPGFESGNSGKQDTEETPKCSKILIQELKASLSSPLGPHAMA